jgi:hypothetical protein
MNNSTEMNARLITTPLTAHGWNHVWAVVPAKSKHPRASSMDGLIAQQPRNMKSAVGDFYHLVLSLTPEA